LTTLTSKIGPEMRKPLVIALEGIDGSGKSTQAKLLAACFENVRIIQHPGYTPSGSKLRELLLYQDFSHCDLAARLLFWADHLLTAETLIQEDNTALTVLDRHPFYSNWAYGTALGTGKELLERLAEVLRGQWIEPALTIILDVSPEVALSRLQRKGKKLDSIEARGLSYLRKVRLAYSELAYNCPEVIVMNAGLSKEEVLIEILEQLRKLNVPTT